MSTKEGIDVAIVGSGPAGMQAALMLARTRKEIVVFDDPQPPRNAASHGVHGFLGLEGLLPAEIRRLAWEQIDRYKSAELRRERIVDIRHDDSGELLVTNDRGDKVTARHVILAIGYHDAHPDVPGFAATSDTISTVKYHLAQYNIARLIAPLDDPLIEPFVAALDPLNRLADEFPGFVWRFQTEEGNSTALIVRDDPLIIVNFSVWESADALADYAYKSGHAAMFRRRREFFDLHEKPHLVCWWITAGHEPTVDEGEERIRHLEEHGPTPHAFTLKQRFPAPDAAPAIESPS